MSTAIMNTVHAAQSVQDAAWPDSEETNSDTILNISVYSYIDVMFTSNNHVLIRSVNHCSKLLQFLTTVTVSSFYCYSLSMMLHSSTF